MKEDANDNGPKLNSTQSFSSSYLATVIIFSSKSEETMLVPIRSVSGPEERTATNPELDQVLGAQKHLN